MVITIFSWDIGNNICFHFQALISRWVLFTDIAQTFPVVACDIKNRKTCKPYFSKLLQMCINLFLSALIYIVPARHRRVQVKYIQFRLCEQFVFLHVWFVLTNLRKIQNLILYSVLRYLFWNVSVLQHVTKASSTSQSWWQHLCINSQRRLQWWALSTWK